MKALTASQMRETDRLTTERYGVPSLQLMENAGSAIAEYLWTHYPDLHAASVVILCGKGNNGGDGFVVARRLRERGVAPEVILFAAPSSVAGDAATNLKSWQQQMGQVQVVTDPVQWEMARASVAEADLVVDALLGTGLKGPVEGLLAQVIEDVNAAVAQSRAHGGSRRLRVVAVDTPSGLPSDGQDFGGPVICAEATVTLTAPKVGQLISSRGSFVVCRWFGDAMRTRAISAMRSSPLVRSANPARPCLPDAPPCVLERDWRLWSLLRRRSPSSPPACPSS
jgi:hydroxyethylthiazole kinase-like uncharacterized protein yjeF